MSTIESRPVPTVRQLIKATAIASVLAAITLVAAVLPAEYGIDPTGAGKALGLNKLHEAGEGSDIVISAEDEVTESQPLKAGGGVTRREIPYKTEEMSITLPPNAGAEVKAVMQAGDAFVFNWTSAAPVNFDMHGEPFNAKSDEFTSYWKGLLASASHGSFVAPFGGTHGWYWRNRSTEPVVVKVSVTGYFEKLYLP